MIKVKSRVLYFAERISFIMTICLLVLSFVALITGHIGMGNKLIFYIFKFIILGSVLYFLLSITNE